MPAQKNIITALLVVAILLLAYVILTPAKRRQQHGKRIFGRAYRYTVSGSAAQTLKCKYRLNEAVYDRFSSLGNGVVDAINERMRLLQSNQSSLTALLEHGRQNGWDEYETIYTEAVQTLIADGTIYPDDGLCGVPVNNTPSDGGVSVSTINGSTGEIETP